MYIPDIIICLLLKYMQNNININLTVQLKGRNTYVRKTFAGHNAISTCCNMHASVRPNKKTHTRVARTPGTVRASIHQFDYLGKRDSPRESAWKTRS